MKMMVCSRPAVHSRASDREPANIRQRPGERGPGPAGLTAQHFPHLMLLHFLRPCHSPLVVSEKNAWHWADVGVMQPV